MEFNCICSLSVQGSCFSVFFCDPLRKFLNKIAENCTMKVPTRSGYKLKIGVTVCKAAQTKYPCEGSACFGSTASLQGNRPFASSHSRGTKPPSEEPETHWERTNKGLTTLNEVSSSLFLSQCVFCSPARQFCTPWMTSCKGSVVTRSSLPLQIFFAVANGYRGQNVSLIRDYVAFYLSRTQFVQ